ncbi:MAG: hypothetical protein WBD87_05830 [Candidatus Acidiferrales bacterium]
MSKKSYDQRTNLEKIQSQWNKVSGLHSREEWSAAIVRAATAAEIAANFAIRREFEERSEFDGDFINSLLRWANGLDGKINRLLLPLSEGRKAHKVFAKIKKNAEEVNKKRNAVAHQGEFCSIGESKETIEKARVFIESVVGIYEPGFTLKDKS